MNYTKCWLEYPRIASMEGRTLTVCSRVEGPVGQRAAEELVKGLDGLYGAAVSLGKPGDITLDVEQSLPAGGYRVRAADGRCEITGGDGAGVLYGVFALLRALQMAGTDWDAFALEEQKAPANALRMLDHWDNLPGDIERGYSGNSFFFKDNEVLVNQRTVDYARLAASVGINGVVLNNVNVKDAATWLISERYYAPLRQIQEILSSYGIKMYLCVNFAASIVLGGLDTADPCDGRVKDWWKAKADEVWANLPGLGGFVVKADSEGQPGPYTYGRDQSDGANLLADAVAPHGGRIIWRCFVYNCQQDWRDTKTDRARAGYDNFMPLDGKFRENVSLQIKNGPMDFQVREPVSPLFGGLKHTKMVLEVQAAQEYTGQQRHVCYLIPWYKEILDTDLRSRPEGAAVAELISGPGQGMAAVANTGDDENWTGHDLAAANLYGFGRLSYDTTLDGETIAREWLRQTFGKQEQVERVLLDILMRSWPAYEKYNAPLGIGWMVNPSHHYGPNVDGYEYDRWGTYHRADCRGIGVDRTRAGTGFVDQYAPELAAKYGDLETCPDELVLFFHHLPYDYQLKSGKTVLQHIYDTHFEGAEEAAQFLEQVEGLKELLRPDVYERMISRFRHQKQHAAEWRDVINTYFYRKTGIPDSQGRHIYP